MKKEEILKRLNQLKSQGYKVLPFNEGMDVKLLGEILGAVIVFKYRLLPRYVGNVIYREKGNVVLRQDLDEELLRTLYGEGHTDKIESYR